MPEQQRRQKPAPKERVEETAEVAAPTERGEKLKGELDDLLDEIDEVLKKTRRILLSRMSRKGVNDPNVRFSGMSVIGSNQNPSHEALQAMWTRQASL